MTRGRLSRILWIGAAAILVAAALVALVAVVRGDFSENDGRILLTLAAVLYAGGTGLAGLALADRGRIRLGRLIAVAAPVCLALVLWGIWSLAFDGADDYDATRSAWSAALVLLVGLIAATSLLLARGGAPTILAHLAAVLATIAAALSVVGIWTEPDNDRYVQAVAVVWILTALAYFLVPVLQRFTTAGRESAVRTLGHLDGVELVAAREPIEGIPVEPPARGENLVLRRIP